MNKIKNQLFSAKWYTTQILGCTAAECVVNRQLPAISCFRVCLSCIEQPYPSSCSSQRNAHSMTEGVRGIRTDYVSPKRDHSANICPRASCWGGWAFVGFYPTKVWPFTPLNLNSSSLPYMSMSNKHPACQILSQHLLLENPTRNEDLILFNIGLFCHPNAVWCNQENLNAESGKPKFNVLVFCFFYYWVNLASRNPQFYWI